MSVYTICMRYDWDETKRLSNIEKHGVDFVAAETVEWEKALVTATRVSNEPSHVSVAPKGRRLHLLEYCTQTLCHLSSSLTNPNKQDASVYDSPAGF